MDCVYGGWWNGRTDGNAETRQRGKNSIGLDNSEGSATDCMVLARVTWLDIATNSGFDEHPVPIGHVCSVTTRRRNSFVTVTGSPDDVSRAEFQRHVTARAVCYSPCDVQHFTHSLTHPPTHSWIGWRVASDCRTSKWVHILTQFVRASHEDAADKCFITRPSSMSPSLPVDSLVHWPCSQPTIHHEPRPPSLDYNNESTFWLIVC